MDPRVDRAQQLYWLVYGSGTTPQPGRSEELLEMARLHEEIARDRLEQADGRGWIDLYAAVTSWGNAGRLRDAQDLISEARRWAHRFPAMQDDIIREILELESWLDKEALFINIPALIRQNSSRGVDRLALVG
jgi:hypothetical protein